MAQASTTRYLGPDADALLRPGIELDGSPHRAARGQRSVRAEAGVLCQDGAAQIYQPAERRLGQREWALGTFSIVDIHLFRLFWRFSRAFPETLAMVPALAAHRDRMMARPAVQRTCEIEAAIGYELPG
jgi:glutathione S-transferase